jgi:hypothetical protein
MDSIGVLVRHHAGNANGEDLRPRQLALMLEQKATCHRCGRPLDPERADLDGWLVLDAREDGWMLVVCRDCQTAAERERGSTGSGRPVLRERLRRAVPLLPELDAQPPRPLSEPRRVAVGERPRDRDQDGAFEQRLAIIGLDGLAAVVARLPLPVGDRVGPSWPKAAAEVASHEHMFARSSSRAVSRKEFPTVSVEKNSRGTFFRQRGFQLLRDAAFVARPPPPHPGAILTDPSRTRAHATARGGS